MSRQVTDVPFAIGTDGYIYVNVAHWGLAHPRALVDRALRQQGELLVAVRASAPETTRILERLRDGTSEAVAYAIASRERTKRRTRAKGRRAKGER